MAFTGLNLDAARAVRINAAEEPWTASPMPGVERKRLERQDAEQGLATSIVRYAPGSSFSAHRHPGGEEFLVLDGVFSDERGDYGPGTYVRNPPGSEHTPRSEPGCVLFVKLCQMPADETDSVVIDTRREQWAPGAVAGHDQMPLHRAEGERVRLERLAPATELPATVEAGGLELLVLDGTLSVNGEAHAAWSWIRLPVGAEVRLSSGEGARLYSKRGHLAVRAR